jgi:hypothetical protein
VGERKVNGRSKQTVLFLDKRRTTAPSTTFQFQLTVHALPVKAGTDPYNKLIDRDSDDIVRRVDLASAAHTRTPDAPTAESRPGAPSARAGSRRR